MNKSSRLWSVFVSASTIIAATLSFAMPAAAAGQSLARSVAAAAAGPAAATKPPAGPSAPVAAPRSYGQGSRVGNSYQPAPGSAPPMITPAQAQAQIQAAMDKGNVSPAPAVPAQALPAHGVLLNALGRVKVSSTAAATPALRNRPLAFPPPSAGATVGARPQFPSGFGSVQQPFTYTGCSIFGANEPDIVQSSVNPNVIVAVVQAYQNAAGGCGDGHAFFATSHDAGLHWVQGGFPGAFHNDASGDVNVTFDPVHNRFIATFLEFSRDAAGNGVPPGRLAVEASSDGVNWGADTTLLTDSATDFADKEWITTQQNPGGAHYGRVVISFTDFQAGGSVYFDAFSDNGGLSWSFGTSSINFNNHNCGNGTAPAFDANGDLMVAWWDCNGGAFLLEEVSPDGGATWPASSDTIITGINDIGTSGTCLMNGGGTAFRCNSFPSLAGDPNTGDQGGTAYVIAWASSENVGGTNLSLIRALVSTNNGANWGTSAFMTFNDNGDKFFPGLSFADNGRLEMTYSNRNASSSGGNPHGTSYNQWETEAGNLSALIANAYITYEQDATLNNPGTSLFIGDYSSQRSRDLNFDTLPIYTVQDGGGVNQVHMRQLCFLDCYTVLGPSSPVFMNHAGGSTFQDFFKVNIDPVYGGSGSNYWNAVGIREGADGTSVDNDTFLSDIRYFNNTLATSSFSPAFNDYLLINQNSGHAPATQYWQQVHSFSTLGGFYTIEWANGHVLFSSTVADGMGGGNVIRVYDSFLNTATLYYVGLRPAGGNTSNYSLTIHSASNGAEQGRGSRVSDSANVAPGQPAFAAYNTGADPSQWDGVVVLNNNGGSGTYTLYRDTVVPTGAISINGGAPFTNSQNVSLTLSSSNASAWDPVMDMSFSNDGVNFGPWQAVAGSAAYTLPAGDGSHTVFVRYRNAAGGVSSAAADSITLDTVAPSTTASLAATNTGCGILYSPVQVTLNAFDATSGVATTTYRVDGGSLQTYAGPFTITAPGSHTVTFQSTDNAGNAESQQSVTFTIGHITLTDSPTSGKFGAPITVSGNNYISGEAVKVYLDTTASSPLLTAAANGACSFSGSFNVPDAVFGHHTLIAVGQTSGQTSSVSFTVNAALALVQTSGPQGSSQTANGHGYKAGQAVQVRWGTSTGPILGTATANSLGAWTLNFVVPVKPAGSYPVIGLGQPSGPTAQQSFKITHTLKITPTHGARGSTATMSFTGFRAGETVTIKWDCTNIGCASGTILATRVANANGNASGITVTIPSATTIATHTIGGVGSMGNFAKAKYTTTS